MGGKNGDKSVSVQTKHINETLLLERDMYQAICMCGWYSSVSYFEEVDLLRAIHAHEEAAFKARK